MGISTLGKGRGNIGYKSAGPAPVSAMSAILDLTPNTRAFQ
jgi:hypothetical protein